MQSDASIRAKKIWRQKLAIWRRTCGSIIAVKQLWSGNLNEEDFKTIELPPRKGAKLSVPVGEDWAVSSLRPLVERLSASWSRQRCEQTKPRGEGAATMRLSLDELGSGNMPKPGGRGGLKRGDVHPLLVYAVSLPKLDRPPARITELSPRVARVFCDPERRMLRPKEVGRPLMEATPSYSDPALGDKAVRVLLAYRQFKAGMLWHTKEKEAEVNFFSVIKKTEEMGAGERQRSRKVQKKAKWLIQQFQGFLRSGRRGGWQRGKKAEPGTPKSQRSGPLSAELHAPCPGGLKPKENSKGGSRHSGISGGGGDGCKVDGSGEVGVVLRLIMDERGPNQLWEDPMTVQLSSPEAIGSMDWSKSSMAGGSVCGWKGDVPDCFYGMMLEPWMRPYFVLPGLKVRDLDDFLEMIGEARTGWPPEEYLCMNVLSMGWSWAVWAAETTVEDIVDRGCSILRQSSRVCYGRPTPQFDQGRTHLWNSHIDDLFGWSKGKDRVEARENAMEALTAVGKALKDAGFGFHKTEVGERLKMVGLEVGEFEDGRLLSGPELEGMEELRGRNRELLERDEREGGVDPREVESVMGHWSFRCLSERSGFAVFDNIYTWMRKAKGRKKVKMWPKVRAELLVADSISSLLYAELDKEWSTVVPCMDASNEGFGVVGTTAEVGVIKEEARWAEQKGWFFWAHPEMRSTAVEQGPAGEGESKRTFDSETPPRKVSNLVDGGPFKPKERLWDQLEAEETGHFGIFVGHRESEWLAGMRAGGLEKISNYVLERGLAGLSDRKWELLEEEVEGGRCIGVVVDAGWSGFSPNQSRWRTRGRPGGTKALNKDTKEAQKAKERIARQDGAFGRILRTLRRAVELGKKVVLAVPDESLAWRMQEVVDFHEDHQEPLRVRTWKDPRGTKVRVLTSEDWINISAVGGELKRKEANEVAIRSGFGGWRIRRPPGLEPAGIQKGMKERAPPLKAEWGDPSRYSIWMRGKWRNKEHCNVLEARTAVSAVKHLTRSQSGWMKRHLALSDSQATIGAFCKGRSSARSFVSLCRRLAAMKFATGVSCYWRYIETWRNASDGPSRGQRWPGVYGAAPPQGWKH